MLETPDVLTKAVLEVTRKIGTLGKAALNPHGGYKYVSIDKFYETVGRTAAEEGLSWTLREISIQIMPEVGKTGAVRVTYAVDLMMETGWRLPNYSCVSIIHPIQGAQTMGSAMSYADKVAMRQMFKVPTGERDIDADETDNRALDPAPKNKPPVSFDLDDVPGAIEPGAKINTPSSDINLDLDTPSKPKIETPSDDADWDVVEQAFKTFMPTARTKEELQFFWSDNVALITKLQKQHPEMHKRVVGFFTERKKQLAKEI